MNRGKVPMLLVPVHGLMLSIRVVNVTMKLQEQQMYLYVLMASLPACLLPPAAATTTTTAFTATFLLLTLQLTTINEPLVPSKGW